MEIEETGKNRSEIRRNRCIVHRGRGDREKRWKSCREKGYCGREEGRNRCFVDRGHPVRLRLQSAVDVKNILSGISIKEPGQRSASLTWQTPANE